MHGSGMAKFDHNNNKDQWDYFQTWQPIETDRKLREKEKRRDRNVSKPLARN